MSKTRAVHAKKKQERKHGNSLLVKIAFAVRLLTFADKITQRKNDEPHQGTAKIFLHENKFACPGCQRHVRFMQENEKENMATAFLLNELLWFVYCLSQARERERERERERGK